MASLDERLVHLVRDRVSRREHDRDDRSTYGAGEQEPQDRVLRDVRQLAEDQVPGPSPVPRLGTDEKAKITPAQRMTGSHTVSADRLGVATCVDIAES